MKPIRNSAKAIIMEDEKILLTVNKDDAGLFYLCPGGGQEHSESLRQAVIRECLEEIPITLCFHLIQRENKEQEYEW